MEADRVMLGSEAEMSGGRGESIESSDVRIEYIWTIIGSQNRKLKCTYVGPPPASTTTRCHGSLPNAINDFLHTIQELNYRGIY